MNRKTFLKSLFGTMFTAPVVASEVINKKEEVPKISPKEYTVKIGESAHFYSEHIDEAHRELIICSG
jgi:hypothetical protein